MSTFYLLSARTTDGNGSAFKHPGGPAMVIVRGTLGGATVKLQASDDGTNWVDLRDGSFTVAEAVLLALPIESNIRASVSGATGTTSITVAII